jgi:hypothetical protein
MLGGRWAVRVNVDPSGNTLSDAGRERDPQARLGQHVHEHVDAEEVDLPAHQVAHPRLRNAEDAGGFCLREIAVVANRRPLRWRCFNG